MNKYLIGFRVAEDKFINKIFPFIDWELKVSSDFDVMEMELLVKKAIEDLSGKEIKIKVTKS